MKLYIIGNGFDLAHLLKTSYCHYKDYLKKKNKKEWSIILEYFPDNYRFWSDIEYGICLLNPTRFMEMKKAKKLFNVSGDLDELLKAIHDSFESFVIEAEADIQNKTPKFILDKDALFLTFNYTTTLETLYNAEHVIHLHNKVEGAVFKKFYGIPGDDCIIGHSPAYEDFPFYSDSNIGSDKDYIAFRSRTTKNCKEIWEKYDLFKFFLFNQNQINEVVFYGFSLSKTDKYYMEQIFLALPTNKSKYTIYYHIGDDEDEKEKVWSIKMNIAHAGGNFEEMNFINDKDCLRI